MTSYTEKVQREMNHEVAFRRTREFVLVKGYWQQACVADSLKRGYSTRVYWRNYHNAVASVTVLLSYELLHNYKEYIEFVPCKIN